MDFYSFYWFRSENKSIISHLYSSFLLNCGNTFGNEHFSFNANRVFKWISSSSIWNDLYPSLGFYWTKFRCGIEISHQRFPDNFFYLFVFSSWSIDSILLPFGHSEIFFINTNDEERKKEKTSFEVKLGHSHHHNQDDQQFIEDLLVNQRDSSALNEKKEKETLFFSLEKSSKQLSKEKFKRKSARNETTSMDDFGQWFTSWIYRWNDDWCHCHCVHFSSHSNAFTNCIQRVFS